MNTTPGTNTNPTAVALATIVYNADRMFPLTGSTQTDRDSIKAIYHAVAVIAERNGNDTFDILEHAREIIESNGG